jgi:hypothetical protein
MDKIELKPCPFCGSEVIKFHKHNKNNKTDVQCLQCGCKIEKALGIDAVCVCVCWLQYIIRTLPEMVTSNPA